MQSILITAQVFFFIYAFMEVKLLGDKIEFPFNNQMYLAKATACIENNDFEQALMYIKKIYATEKNYAINYFYAFILFSLERYEEALEVADEYKELYLKSNEYILMYTLLLIKNHQFLEAESIIQKKKKDPLFSKKQEWQNIQQELRKERVSFQKELDLKRKETKNKLMQMDRYSLMEQVQLIEEAHSLELKDLQEVANQLLNHPYIPGQIQRGFLEVLIEKGDEQQYPFSWFNQMKKVCPKDLNTFNDLPVLQEIDWLLEEKLQKDPSLFQMIRTEIINDFLILYPFVEETITDTSYWVDLYIAYFKDLNSSDLDNSPTNPEQERLQQWFQQLNQIAQRK